MSYWSAEEDEAPYSGPITRSRAKTHQITALGKASSLMANDSLDWVFLRSVPMQLLSQSANGSSDSVNQL